MKSTLVEDWVALMLPEASYSKSMEKISGVAIDSRLVQPGDLFFALSGNTTDGHCFLRNAAKAGAVAAVVSKKYRGESFGLELIRVEDPKCALKEAGHSQYNLFQGNVIGIAGSLGKTTTKEFSKIFLSSTYKVFSSPKSYNSQLTVPLSLLMADGDEDFILLEMGVSEPGNMQNLLSIVQPDIVVMTHIADQHTKNFPSGVQGILEEKSLILNNSRLQLLPKDSLWYDHLRSKSSLADIFSFSFHDQSADFCYKAIDSQTVTIQTPDEDIHLPIALSYKPAYVNLLIAVSLAWLLKVSIENLIYSLPSLQLPPMRFEQSIRNGIHIINDAYNACPEAMLAALDALPNPSEEGRIILILGHMSELGAYSDEGHAIVAMKALSKANMIFFVGEKWSLIQHTLKDQPCQTSFYSSVHDIEPILKNIVKQGDVVFLKGSRCLALESLLVCF
ncbi:UDP-N-acetylmuramoyl-tripeptide--D-alanyl-D-alanine ligase [Chlamydia sp. 17-3921]|uniref:UDP-N-acetylmuramoyl-tripeptide--D-alanyl-D- alanine ligase n=1 Tax=Chlamydia sp. 17-3921 TaxID=2675798 RepID=UPI00191982D2|nr:UDP-N-acetylmuramoyl-tripeptide--D-alanyl-D-alanine ligase [Chlamydia sp. 17-3921]